MVCAEGMPSACSELPGPKLLRGDRLPPQLLTRSLLGKELGIYTCRGDSLHAGAGAEAACC